MMGGVPVSWRSQSQKVVALSTTKAEYMVCANAARHISWVWSYLFNIFGLKTGPTPLYVNKTSDIANATSEGTKSWSKRIDQHHHYIFELVEDGRIEISQVPTLNMLADHLTKPLSPEGLSHALTLKNAITDS